MHAQTSLLAELEHAIQSGSREKRVEALRRITDLFLASADQFNEAQIDLFDDVLCHLIQRIEIRALSELSVRLAPVHNAPPEVIRKLALDDEIIVAGPVLAQSTRLTSDDLIEVAKTKSQGHLLAIAQRADLDDKVTDQLLARRDSEVAYRLANNAGARFSEGGFKALVKHAETDESVAKKVGLRLDLPLRLLRELLLIATEAVRSWLLHNAPLEARAEIERVITTISNQVSQEAAAPRDFSRAQELIASMRRQNELSEAALRDFAESGKYEEMVVALATLSSAPLQAIAAVMKSARHDGILVACKAAGIKWRTVDTILRHRFAHHTIPDDEIARAKAGFLILSQPTAERTLRFWRTRIGGTTFD